MFRNSTKDHFAQEQDRVRARGHCLSFRVLAQGGAQGKEMFLQGQFDNLLIPSLPRRLWRAVLEMSKWSSEEQELGDVTGPSKAIRLTNIY